MHTRCERSALAYYLQLLSETMFIAAPADGPQFVSPVMVITLLLEVGLEVTGWLAGGRPLPLR